MKQPCIDCGGDAGRGWTDGEAHDTCAACEVAGALETRRPQLTPETVARVVRAAGRFFQVPPRNLISRSREPDIVTIRAAIYLALYETHTATTHRAIAALMNRDPRVVCDGMRRAKALAAADERYAKGLTMLQQEARRGSA